MAEKLLLIDGHSILNRAYFGIPDLTNSEGLHTNAVYGFLNILFKTIDTEKPDYLTVAFDVHAPTFRHKMFEAYKGTRKPMQPELREQVPLMKEMLRAMGIPVVEKEGYEADDLLGTLSVQAEEKGLDVRIVSGDRDLLQLATKKVVLLIPKTKKTGTEIEVYDEDAVKEKYLVSPKEFVDVKALMGDSSDNIPGVMGIGEKGATKLIAQYHSIDEVFNHIEEVKPARTKNALVGNEEIAVLSKTLAKINCDSPIQLDLEKAALTDLYTEEAYVMMKRLDFKNFLSRFSEDAKTDPLEGKIVTLSSYEEAVETLESLKEDSSLSLFLLQENTNCDGVFWCSDSEQIYYIEVSQGLALDAMISIPEAQNLILKMLDSAHRLISLDVKGLLHFLEIEQKVKEEYKEKLYDAKIAAYLLNPLKGKYSYDDIASEYGSCMLPAKEDLLQKKIDPADRREKLIRYGAAAAYGLYLSIDGLLMALTESSTRELYDKIEMPLVYTLASMEAYGVKADRNALIQYSEELGQVILVLEQEIYDLAGEKFNILSPKQLGTILFEKLQLPNGKKTKTGYSTAADVLEKLAPDHPIVEKVLKYRQLTKLKSTYADSLQNDIAADGRIHTSFNQTVTATGRLSSTEPNLQNIPIREEMGRQIRKVFVAEEGYTFIDADYSQIELRVLAHMSGDDNLIKAYNEAQDIHTLTASQVFHVPFEEITPLQRRNAKAVNFGIIYGISSFGLSQDLSITKKEAQEYMDHYFAAYPKIKEFLDGLVESAKESGFAKTIYGRIRPMPELSSSNFMQRSFGERVAMNAPIQGTAADIIKIAMNRVYARILKENLKSRLLLQVHDELLIEAAPGEEEMVYQILQEEMTSAADLKVKLEVDINEGKNWYEAK
jgi:DNA polymerase I